MSIVVDDVVAMVPVGDVAVAAKVVVNLDDPVDAGSDSGAVVEVQVVKTTMEHAPMIRIVFLIYDETYSNRRRVPSTNAQANFRFGSTYMWSRT